MAYRNRIRIGLALFFFGASLVGCSADDGTSVRSNADGSGGGSAVSSGAGDTTTGQTGATGTGGTGGGTTGQGGDQGTGGTLGPTEHVTAVWAVNDGEKVERDDVAHPAKQGNSAWDGHTVRIFGGRNEIVAAQIIVEAGPAGISELRVSLPSLVGQGGGGQIAYAAPGDDPTDYVGRPIQIFSENYMTVTNPTSASWIVEPDTPAAPKDMVGQKPVQLVPENAMPGRGGMPLSVAAGMNQAIWIDVYVPRDVPAGLYDGTVKVETDGEIRNLPIELQVFDFTLPDENVVNYMLYYEGDQVQEYQGQNLDERYHRFAHRNRVEFVNGYDHDAVVAQMPLFDGGAFKSQASYAGPGEGVGNRIIPRTFYDPGTLFDTQSSAWTEADNWITFLKSNLPKARTLLYMPDEPSSSEFSQIQTIADNVHGDPGPGKALPIFVTHAYTSQLDTAIDIWCPDASHYDPTRAAKERSLGRDMWYYNGRRPNIGSLIIDSPATDARVHGWAAFAQAIPVYFFWHVDHWHHNHNAPSDYDKVQNVWANAMTFINTSGEFANGDGVLVYPGTEVLHSDQDRGILGPVSTIQMANLRRGAQDALYLSMAKACGLSSLVQSSVQAIVPAVFSNAGSTVSFPETGDPYEAARKALAQALQSCH